MLSIAALSLAASIAVVQSIHIESRWAGLGTPSAATYTIVRRGHRYKRRFAIVPNEAVDRFVAALTAPPVHRNAALRALATPEWLNARATEPHPDVSVPRCSPDAKRLLQQQLADPEHAVKTLSRYYTSWRTDDYPFVSIDVRFTDRKPIHLQSSAPAGADAPVDRRWRRNVEPRHTAHPRRAAAQ